ncbi:hypothetical protein PYV02_14840 [Leifsonia sp. H3M29-4]|uniref:hypothetical protein n=1 Tax=Salinibacterium metalliresistens TaxID=3031321 RepID=UPI0023DB6EBE|nr:hypothetical protein [Salinibacterium metalliresistens]MDF1480360.1 hypothetical protein [Salinibacterium metalliresistens]
MDQDGETWRTGLEPGARLQALRLQLVEAALCGSSAAAEEDPGRGRAVWAELASIAGSRRAFAGAASESLVRAWELINQAPRMVMEDAMHTDVHDFAVQLRRRLVLEHGVDPHNPSELAPLGWQLTDDYDGPISLAGGKRVPLDVYAPITPPPALGSVELGRLGFAVAPSGTAASTASVPPRHRAEPSERRSEPELGR